MRLSLIFNIVEELHTKAGFLYLCENNGGQSSWFWPELGFFSQNQLADRQTAVYRVRTAQDHM
jgi:hypothetical protein